MAIVAGMALGIPGPFDLLALGRLATGGFALVTAVLTILGFGVVKFVLIEVPIASYAINPAGTKAKVERFSGWMRAHHTTLIAPLAGGVGILLIGQGVSRIG